MKTISRFILLLRPYASILLVIWISAVIIVSSIPDLPTLKIQSKGSVIRLDYLIHFLEYAITAFLAFFAFERKDFSIDYKKYAVIITMVLIFAVGDEYHQKLIPGRTFNPGDLLCNAIGIFGGMGLYLLLKPSDKYPGKKLTRS